MLTRLPLALVALLLLVTAGSGQAAPPRLAADVPLLDLYPTSTVPGHTGATEADLYMPAGKEMAKVVLYFPAGYAGILGRPLNGNVGDVVFWDSKYKPAVGYIFVADPTQHTTDPCAPGTHQALWVLAPDNSGDFPDTGVFIDATSGSETALGAYKAQFCLPSSSSVGTKIHELDLNLLKLTNPAAVGAYTWRAFVTPYKNSAPDSTGTFELRGTIPMPMTLTLHGRYDRRHKRAILTGKLSAQDYDVQGTYIDLYANGRYAGPARANKSGLFTLKRRIKKTTRFVVWTANYSDCTDSTAPGGCPSDALANVSSRVVKVVVPKR